MNYPNNRPPLQQKRYLKLPLGAIKPRGWLRRQLEIQWQGLTGHMEEIWLKNDWWRGGNGVNAARKPSKMHMVPYWLNGAIPLAYQLDDDPPRAAIQPFVDYALTNRQANGFFGPTVGEGPDYATCAELGRAHMIRVLTEYHEATGDPRVIETLLAYYTGYFAENMDRMTVGITTGCLQEHHIGLAYTYNQTADAAVLEAARRLCTVTEPVLQWTVPGLKGQVPTNHGCLVAWGLKFPTLEYVVNGNPDGLTATRRILDMLYREFGQVGGRYAAHEWLPVRQDENFAKEILGGLGGLPELYKKEPWRKRVKDGHQPTHGTELCDVVELMYSLERCFEIGGEPADADRLELLAFNDLPGTCTGDFWAHQYLQQANQVVVSIAPRYFDISPESNIYGLNPNYDCCLGNMHQGWPRLVEHLWMATPDGGLAAIIPGPCQVQAKVADQVPVTLSVDTEYPFDGTIRCKVSELAAPTTFPLRFRIPGWADGAIFELNGGPLAWEKDGPFALVQREWRTGDVVKMVLPMPVKLEERYGGAYAVRRGSLYFVLRIPGRYQMLRHYNRGASDWAIWPTGPWNVGLVLDKARPDLDLRVHQNRIAGYPLAQRDEPIYTENAKTNRLWQGNRYVPWAHDEPVVLKATGQVLPEWKMDKNYPDAVAGDPPKSPKRNHKRDIPVELIPYACSRLRIAEFPVLPSSKSARQASHAKPPKWRSKKSGVQS